MKLRICLHISLLLAGTGVDKTTGKTFSFDAGIKLGVGDNFLRLTAMQLSGLVHVINTDAQMRACLREQLDAEIEQVKRIPEALIE